MDKVINFEDNESPEDNDLQEDLEDDISDNEMTVEERSYYNSITLKKSFNIDLFFNNDNNKKVKKKKRKDKNLKNQNDSEIINIFNQKNKTWKSSRAEKHKKTDGKIKIEKRTFNPRPLPSDWNERNKSNKLEQKPSKTPSLQSLSNLNKDNVKTLQFPKLSGAWSKMIKKN